MSKLLAALLFGVTMLGMTGVAGAYHVLLMGERAEISIGILPAHLTGRWHNGWYWRYYAGDWHRVFGQHYYNYYYGKYGYGEPCIKCIDKPP